MVCCVDYKQIRSLAAIIQSLGNKRRVDVPPIRNDGTTAPTIGTRNIMKVAFLSSRPGGDGDSHVVVPACAVKHMAA